MKTKLFFLIFIFCFLATTSFAVEIKDETSLFPSPPPARRTRMTSQEALRDIFQTPLIQTPGIRIGLLADTALRFGAELSGALRVEYRTGILGFDAELAYLKTEYGAIHKNATSTESSAFPSGGASENPGSEVNRARGRDDSWGAKRIGVGVSAAGNFFNNTSSNFSQKGRFGISRVSASDERYGLDFSGWWFSVEASFPYLLSKKGKVFFAPLIRHEWAFVHRDGAELSSYRRLSLQRLSVGVELGFGF